MLLYGGALVLGAAAGNDDPFRPLAFSDNGETGIETVLPFERVKSIEDLDRELARAQQAGRPVMLDFYADWCISCKEMEHFTFSKLRVREALADVVLLQADVTANDDIDKALMKRFGIIGPPAILFFRDGREIRRLRLYGFKKADDFVMHLSGLEE